MRYSTEKETEQDEKKKLYFKTLNKIPTISEWFISLEGEGKSIGEPSLYIRLNGCYSAKCSWCDSKYSWYSDEGKKLEEIGNDIKEAIKGKEIKRLTITGGEPLHFIKNLNSIVAWLKELNIHFDFIGIESNGNLLQDEHIVMETIKTFNKIQMDTGTLPTLTISPKLDAKECYNNELSQEEVWEMYSKVIDNCMNYFNKKHLYFKFVWNIFADSNDNNLMFIDKLKSFNVERNHIMLMPWTPENPKTTNVELWNKSQHFTAREALNIGIKYSPRLHIDIDMD